MRLMHELKTGLNVKKTDSEVNQSAHLGCLSRLLAENDEIDEGVRAVGVLLHGLLQGGLGLVELALLQEGSGLAIQEQRCRSELVDHFLVNVVCVLDLVTALERKGTRSIMVISKAKKASPFL